MKMRKNKFILTGSTWAAVFALNSYMSRPKLWRIINGLEEENDFPHPAKQYGKDMEPVSRRVFIDIFDKYFHNDDNIYRFIERGSKALSYDTRFGQSPDNLIIIWDKVGEGCEYKNPWSKDIPRDVSELDLGHVMQSILGMEVYQVPVWNVFYYRDETKEKAWFRVHRNETFFKEVLYPEAVRFMNLPDEPKRVPGNFKSKWEKAILENFKIEKIEL